MREKGRDHRAGSVRDRRARNGVQHEEVPSSCDSSFFIIIVQQSSYFIPIKRRLT